MEQSRFGFWTSFDGGITTASKGALSWVFGWLMGDQIGVRVGLVMVPIEGWDGGGRGGLKGGLQVGLGSLSRRSLTFVLGPLTKSGLEMRQRGWGDGGRLTRLVVRLGLWWWWSDVGSGGDVVVRLVSGWYWAWLTGWNILLHSLDDSWALTLLLGIYVYFYAFHYVYISVLGGLWPLISRYHMLVGLSGLCPGVCTLCAWFALVRRCVVKWTYPPSGKMKLSVVRYCSVRQHSGKAILIALWHCIIFPVCHHLCKANRVAVCALFANWCMLEYISFVETLVIIQEVLFMLHVNWGLGIMSPPLYYEVSLLIKA